MEHRYGLFHDKAMELGTDSELEIVGADLDAVHQAILASSASRRSKFCSFASTAYTFAFLHAAAVSKSIRKVSFVLSAASTNVAVTWNRGPDSCRKTIRSGFTISTKTLRFLYSTPSGPRMTERQSPPG